MEKGGRRGGRDLNNRQLRYRDSGDVRKLHRPMQPIPQSMEVPVATYIPFSVID